MLGVFAIFLLNKDINKDFYICRGLVCTWENKNKT